MCSGTRYGDHHSIVRWVQQHLDRPSYLVHRLDRFTRGVMVIAHSKAVAARLSQQFAQRTVRKEYQAEVAGRVRGELTLSNPVDGKPAVSHVMPLRTGPTSVVAVRIETGRKHQIRRHLADAGFPVVGDRLYGQPDAAEDLQLVAVCLLFSCPQTGRPVQYRLPETLCLEAPDVS